jgi:hypothetical protein
MSGSAERAGNGKRVPHARSDRLLRRNAAVAFGASWSANPGACFLGLLGNQKPRQVSGAFSSVWNEESGPVTERNVPTGCGASRVRTRPTP